MGTSEQRLLCRVALSAIVLLTGKQVDSVKNFVPDHCPRFFPRQKPGRKLALVLRGRARRPIGGQNALSSLQEGTRVFDYAR